MVLLRDCCVDSDVDKNHPFVPFRYPVSPLYFYSSLIRIASCSGSKEMQSAGAFLSSLEACIKAGEKFFLTHKVGGHTFYIKGFVNDVEF